MSLATPQVITYNAVANDLHRIASDATSSTYATADGTLKMVVSHQQTKTRIRRLVKLERKVLAVDPLTAENAYQSASVHMVVDEPSFGFDDTNLDYQVDALVAWFTAANIAAVLASRH